MNLIFYTCICTLPVLNREYTHAHAHTEARTHVHIHTCTRTHMHAHMHTRAYTYAHTRARFTFTPYFHRTSSMSAYFRVNTPGRRPWSPRPGAGAPWLPAAAPRDCERTVALWVEARARRRRSDPPLFPDVIIHGTRFVNLS